MKKNFITRYFRRRKLRSIKKHFNNQDMSFEYNSTQDKYYFGFQRLYEKEFSSITYPYIVFEAWRHKRQLIRLINENLDGVIN